MIFALLPAAGHSTRMGRPKLSLPLGERTVIEHVVGALRQSEIQHVLVVVGPHVPEVIPLANAAGARFLLLEEPTPDMRSTIEAGLGWITANWQPTTDDALLLVPADHPALDERVIRQMLAARGNDILIPTFNGRRGHPTLIGWPHIEGIRAMPSDCGLNTYFRQHSEAVRELPVDLESILFDLDTPEDYERIGKMLIA